MNQTKDKRFGIFTIERDTLCGENRAAIMDIMGHCVITRCEYMAHSDCFEYCAWSPLFRALDQGEMMPEYGWIFREGKALEAAELDTHRYAGGLL